MKSINAITNENEILYAGIAAHKFSISRWFYPASPVAALAISLALSLGLLGQYCLECRQEILDIHAVDGQGRIKP